MSLQRFHHAQASQWAGYATALAEMRAGRKNSHWIWYIFPQIDGLGRSSTAREYALGDLADACAYLRDPLLRSRYEAITSAVAEHLSHGAPIEELMGGSTDAHKLVSSLTLFRTAAAELAQDDGGTDFKRLSELCASILERTSAQGYPPCEFTQERCAP
ncbi:MAG: DUF1810 family protein [Chthoniobacter sp.]|uniref:DUF1810 domain-containing protein n=1 Tax=Chthoniobacter sp. TaxID=2510640 RepID=UPI0032A99C15